MARVTFSRNEYENYGEVLSIVKQLKLAKPGESIKVFGSEFPAQAFNAKGSKIKGTLPAVVIPGIAHDPEGDVMTELTIIGVNPIWYPHQKGGFLARIKGRIFGLALDNCFIPGDARILSGSR